MASKVPVVGADAGGIPHTIRPVEGTGSFLVKTGDIDGYVQKLKLLQDDPALREQMGTRAREEMLKWSWENSMAQMQFVYEIAKENKRLRWENRIWRTLNVGRKWIMTRPTKQAQVL
jgi:glycosyltransferase involved in cell wall biosynthesis